MVTVKVNCHNGRISKIHISGHAEYDEYGNDLVCAGASTISIGAMNALDELFKDDCQLEMNENVISIKVLKFKESLDLVLNFLLLQFETMVEGYPKNIRIIRKEV